MFKKSKLDWLTLKKVKKNIRLYSKRELVYPFYGYLFHIRFTFSNKKRERYAETDR